MFTKQQLAKWKSDGFPFPPEYEEWAVEAEPIDPSIYSVSVLKSDKKNEGGNFNFVLRINLNVPTYFDYSIEINVQDGSASNVYQKQGSFNNSTYYSEAKIAKSIMFSEKIFDIAVAVRKNRLTQYGTGKVVSEKKFKVLVKNNGGVSLYDGEPLARKSLETLITLSEFISIFGDKRLFTGKGMDKYPNVYNIEKQNFVDALNKNLVIFEIDSPIRLAHFFGQIEHESDHLNTTQEYASGIKYNDRGDLGNTQEGDGPRFKGRGLIQLTGKKNYTKYSTFYSSNNENGIDFTVEPNNLLLASNIQIAVNVSGWFWQIFKGLNRYADEDDLIYITYLVNGGFNGYDDRKEKVIKSIKTLNVELEDSDDTEKELGVYNVIDSRLYDRYKGIFTWAKYFDPYYLKLIGTGKDKQEAKKAYQRTIDLYDSNKVKQTKANKDIYAVAKKRIDLL